MKLTKEQALELHRRMWSDMQNILGDCPHSDKREDYKIEWCRDCFLNESISSYCFLCEYDDQFDDRFCAHCPIDWSNGGEDDDSCIRGRFTYTMSPISDILALPVREDA